LAVVVGSKMAHDALAMIEYRDEPAVLVWGQSEAGRRLATRAVEAAGARVAAIGEVEGAVARMREMVAADAVVVDADAVGPGLEDVLDWIEAAARDGRCRSVVRAPESLIDLIVARAPDVGVEYVGLADEDAFASAIAMAAARHPTTLHDIGREGAVTLHRLSEEVGRIADALASLSRDEERQERGEGPEEIDAPFIRAVIRSRRVRDQYFHADLFADPAWDMLLDLAAARLEGKKVAVSSLCIAAAVPATTALRWIKAMTDQRLFVREADPGDRRRVHIALSDDTARRMMACLAAMRRLAPMLI
jgi:hypothetical protein